MIKPRHIPFYLLTGLSAAATVEPFALYTMSTIHVTTTQRAIVAGICLSVVVFTLGLWRGARWSVVPAVAANAVFFSWYLYRLEGTINSGNFMAWECLIVPFAWATTLVVAIATIVTWGDRYCNGE